jgi:GNAT superfamily N-acetyltransferase
MHGAMPEVPYGIRVVPAEGAAVAGGLALLPELLEQDTQPSRLWAAHLVDRPAAMVGAAAVLPVLHDTCAPGFRVIARVLPAYQRRRIATALLHFARTEACDWGVSRLHSWYAHAPSGASAFLRSVGFQSHESVHHFIGETEHSLKVCSSRLNTWRARGRIPPDARVVPLDSVHLGSVVRLYRSHSGGSLGSLQDRLASTLQNEAVRQLSVAVVRNDELLGFLLTKCPPDTSVEADLWISRPDHRQGWVSLLSLHGTLQRCAAIGAKQHRFHCNGSARATLRFAQQTGAWQTAVHHTYRLELQA